MGEVANVKQGSDCRLTYWRRRGRFTVIERESRESVDQENWLLLKNECTTNERRGKTRPKRSVSVDQDE